MKSKHLWTVFAAALLASVAPQAVMAQPAPTNEAQAEAAREAKFKAMDAELHPQSGTVAIPEAKASLNLSNRYYFLPADEAKRVLTEAWGNPPDQVTKVLGLIFPAGKSFHDQTWGAVVTYEETGHVSDKDAASQDYNSVLSDMKSAVEDSNKQSTEQGYPAQHLIGWAQQPTYDSASKTLIWARNIQFEGQGVSTLNYDVRTLGRTGVLSLNMVDVMPDLPEIREAAKGLGSTVKFNPGAAYADFNSSTDKVADYGLAGLVAAGAGVLVAKKVGLLAVILLFLKKAIALVVAGVAGLGAWLKRKFSRGYQEEAYDEQPAEELPPAE
jgi:uncharacterized membrane-anchored protein